MKFWKKGNIKFIIFPDEKSEPHNFSLSWKWFRVWIIFVSILFLFIAVGGATYFRLVKTAVDYRKLKSEHMILLEQLKKVNEMEKKFSQLKNYNQKLRSILSVYVSFEDVDTSNIGGLKENPLQISTIYEHIPSLLPVEGYISREFEPETHPAIDIVADQGTPIKSAAKGRVVFSGWNKKSGNTIIIYHGDGYLTVYKHNLMNLVNENEYIDKGQVIGYLGGTGILSSGPHLHFEIWKDNRTLNPFTFININEK
ncbi:MAG: M23 family metallopeptidase [Calditrichia bacterium]